MSYYSAIRKAPDGSYLSRARSEMLTPRVRLDDNSNPVHGSWATIYLSEIPWKGPTQTEYSVAIAGYTMVDSDPGVNEFSLEWFDDGVAETGIVYFQASDLDAKIATYYGIGASVDWEKLQAPFVQKNITDSDTSPVILTSGVGIVNINEITIIPRGGGSGMNPAAECYVTVSTSAGTTTVMTAGENDLTQDNGIFKINSNFVASIFGDWDIKVHFSDLNVGNNFDCRVSCFNT